MTGEVYSIDEQECDHRNSILTRRVTSNGAIQVWRQCLSCGSAVGSAIARVKVSTNIHELPPWDDALRDEWRRRQYQERLAQRAHQSAVWFASYSEYLESAEWGAKRRAVLTRSGGICEGCGSAAATQIHHLTYDHAGHVYPGGEFLWELVAVCDHCHERAHPQPVANEDAA